jgi:hypothetical protein
VHVEAEEHRPDLEEYKTIQQRGCSANRALLERNARRGLAVLGRVVHRGRTHRAMAWATLMNPVLGLGDYSARLTCGAKV